jgi:hypothetical protein
VSIEASAELWQDALGKTLIEPVTRRRHLGHQPSSGGRESSREV